MRKFVLRFQPFVFCGIVIAALASQTAVSAQKLLPNPVLYISGQEYYSTGGKQFIRYVYSVFNADAYPAELFAASPALPPCGANNRASRTWVDFFDQQGRRLNGFCAITNSRGLSGIWFALEEGVIPPSWIYIEMTDRQTNTKYKSNLAETTL